MSRGLGLAEWLASAPDVVVVIAAVLTQLGDLWFLSLSLVSLYWLGPHTPGLGDAVDRDRMAVAVGLLFLTVALTVVLKEAFALPRPPWFTESVGPDSIVGPFTPVYDWFADASGYGFPSGHAIGSTIGWGAMAWAVRAGRRRTRMALAGTVVVVVSLTRLVLGVHYLVDTVAGAIIGLALLALVCSWRTPTVPFALAPVFGLVGLGMAGMTTDAAGAFGLALGGAVGWVAAGRRSVSVADTTAAYWATAVGLLFLIPVLALAAVGPVPPVVTLFATAVGGVGVVTLPLLMVRLERRIEE